MMIKGDLESEEGLYIGYRFRVIHEPSVESIDNKSSKSELENSKKINIYLH